MAVLDILHYPDPRLREKAQPVAVVDDRIRQLADDMIETMYDAKGIGLAATQVGVRERVVVMDLSENGDAPQIFINPEILSGDGETEVEEGCLSVPGYFEPVKRLEHVKVRALDRDGKPLEFEADALFAVCVQHEIDHLNGKLFVDYLSELKRSRIRKRLEKAQRQAPVSDTGARQRAPVI
ncbi:MAG: peptide deformylase [Xanthomonadaceae bacterium]|nr:peptide deformylase [Xanthomonadaceae bacterium]